MVRYLNEEKARKWNQLTERAYFNGQGYLVFVIDEDVYNCPYVMDPIVGDFMTIGFESLEEAETVSSRIKNSQ